MKYLVGETANGTAVFAVKGENAVNVTALNADIGADLMALAHDSNLGSALQSQIDGAPSVSVSQITPALPIADPSAIICVGLNYVEHVKEGGYDIPDYPALFMRSKASIMAAGQPMVRPVASEKLDYEACLLYTSPSPRD